ncbi:MAG TPA: carbohydrate ABC transporter permease, partial [Burkholderiaceae bacterium]|nr:carbohydrate ABC transporter permease [Burkholderiaceae bacterium]
MSQPRPVISAGSVEALADHSEGMSYLSTLPRRVVSVYTPLALIVIVLLFPFYWMVMTAIKPKDQLLDLDKHNPYYTLSPTFDHIYDLL